VPVRGLGPDGFAEGQHGGEIELFSAGVRTEPGAEQDRVDLRLAESPLECGEHDTAEELAAMEEHRADKIVPVGQIGNLVASQRIDADVVDGRRLLGPWPEDARR
jgi:hypothetical protein